MAVNLLETIWNVFSFSFFDKIQPNLKEICSNSLFIAYDSIRVTLESNIKFKCWNEVNGQNPLLTGIKPHLTTLQPQRHFSYPWVVFYKWFLWSTSSPVDLRRQKYPNIRSTLPKCWVHSNYLKNQYYFFSLFIRTFTLNRISTLETKICVTPSLSPEINTKL